MNQLFQWLRFTVWPSRWRWLPGSVSVIVVLASIKLGILQPSEYMAYNTFIRLRGKQQWHDDIVVIEIDEKTLNALGQLPISRDKHAQVLDILREAESSIVVFNLFFSEPSPHDERLAQAMLHHGQVVLGYGKPSFPHERFSQNLYNTAISVGHILNFADSDGITRSIRPYTYLENLSEQGRIDDRAFASLGFVAIQAYSLTKDLVPMPDVSQKFWLNWPDSAARLQRYSFIDVIGAPISQGSPQTVNPIVFRDKVVIIGVSAPGVNPILTPFDDDAPTSGIAVHAAVMTNLLYRNYLRPMTTPWNRFILLLGGPIMSIYLSTTGVKRRWLFGFGVVAMWLLGAYILLKVNYLVPLVWPLLLISLGVGFTEIGVRLAANARLQKEVDRLWQTYRQDVLLQGTDYPLSSWISSPHAPHPENPQRWNGQSSSLPSSPSFNPSSSPFLFKLFQPVAVQRIHQLALLAELFGRSQSLHGAIARSLSIGLIAADWDGYIWFCNPAATRFMNAAIGDPLRNILIPTWLSQPIWERYLYTLRQGQSIHWEHYHQEKWFELILEPLFNSHEDHSRIKSPVPTTMPHSLATKISTNSSLPFSLGQDFPPSKQKFFFSQRTSFSPSLQSQPLKKAKDLGGQENTLTGFLLSIEDITPYKQVEVEMRYALTQANEFNTLKSRFVSMVSHELRTPLTIIRASIEMLERRQSRLLESHQKLANHHPGVGSEEADQEQYNQRKYFKRIDQAVSTMTQLLEDVLLLGRMESKKLEFKPIYKNILEFCHSIVDEMQAYSAGQPRIIFNHKGTKRGYYFDPNLVRIILTNLLSNGLKYSAEDTYVYLDLECYVDRLFFQVSDQGIGISMDDQKSLFEEFHRADNVGNIPGTGLGLSIVKQCVDLHEGTITVESEINVGSMFIVNLPSHS